MYSIRIVTTLGEFEVLAERWNCLLRQTAADNIFLTWEWLYTWARHYLGAHRLWIILVYNNREELVGIAPFYIEERTRFGLLRCREMRFLGTHGVSSLYLDFIVPEKHKKAVLPLIFQFLHQEGRTWWDILTLTEIPADSSTLNLWQGLVQDVGKALDIVGRTVCPVINLPSQIEEFTRGISGNRRYNLKRKRKRLEQAGHVAYERICSSKDTEEALEAFIRLHELRWENVDPRGTFFSESFRAFHREICQTCSKNGWIHFDFLRLNGEAMAGIYGFSYNGRYSFYLPGFNPHIMPQVSPGILLLFHSIREAIREGHKEFDLLRGAADYKMAWANSLRCSLTLRHYNRHVRAAAMKLVEDGKAVLRVLMR